jgi:hypothetical protein
MIDSFMPAFCHFRVAQVFRWSEIVLGTKLSRVIPHARAHGVAFVRPATCGIPGVANAPHPERIGQLKLAAVSKMARCVVCATCRLATNVD